MKKLVYASVAVSMLVSGGAFAAKTTKANSTKKAKTLVAVSTKSSKKKNLIAQNTTPATTQAPTALTPAGAGQAQSTASAAAVTAEAKPKRFGFLLVDQAEISMQTANRQKGEAEGTLTVKPSYKLSDVTSVALGMDIYHSYGVMENGKAKWSPDDLYAQFSHSKVGTLPGDIAVKASARFYAPTSELSQANGQIGRLRTTFSFGKSAGKWSFAYINEPQLYFQQYLTTAPNDEGNISGTRTVRLLHYIKTDFGATDKINMYGLAGLDHGWYNGDSNARNGKGEASPVEAIRKEAMFAELGVEYAINDNVGVGAGITQYGPDLLRQAEGQQGPMFRDDFTNYFLNTSLSF